MISPDQDFLTLLAKWQRSHLDAAIKEGALFLNNRDMMRLIEADAIGERLPANEEARRQGQLRIVEVANHLHDAIRAVLKANSVLGELVAILPPREAKAGNQ